MGQETFLLLKEHFREIISILGGIGMFFLGKKKRKQAEKSQNVSITGGELDNVEAALKIYRVMLDDLQTKLTEAQLAYTSLEERFQEAAAKNKKYEENILILEEDNEYLKQRLDKCENI
jgi:chromosome segregation ATPase